MSLLAFKSRNHPQQPTQDEADDRALPALNFATLHKRFLFTLDVAAAPHNAKLPRYFTRAENGLAQSWAGERVYCNPPYSDIEPWLEKAWAEVDASLIVMLLPANRTEQYWWQQWVEPYRDSRFGLRVEFLPGRLRFLKPGQAAIGPNERPPFGCCLLIWSGIRPALPVAPVSGDLFGGLR